jgi:hypothetical protein
MPVYLQYGVKDGLPSNLIYCSTQDHNGLMWFGTDKGLVCYDGSRFHTYTKKDGLPDPEVLSIFEDSQQRLWLCCFRHKPCYYKDGKFYTEQQDSILNKISFKNASFEISEDVDGSIWLAALSGELYQLKDQSLRYYDMSFPATKAGMVGDSLFAFCMGTMQMYSDHGWVRVDSLCRFWKDSNKQRDFVNVSIKGRRMLFSVNGMLLLIDFNNAHYQLVQKKIGISGRSYLDRESRFWICSSIFGAICYDNHQLRLDNPVPFLQGYKVNQMYQDRQGTYWFCTFDNGLIALPKNYAIQYTTQDKLASNNITALTGRPGQAIVAGDDQGKIYTIRGKSIVTTDFGSLDGYNRVRKIIIGDHQETWIATEEALILKENASIKRIKTYGNPKIIMLQNDQLWLGASKSVGAVNTHNLLYSEVEKRRFTAMCDDRDGYVWAGGIDGLSSNFDRFKSLAGEHFPILKSRIVALANAGKGYIWAVTPENGLLKVTVSNGQIINVVKMNEHLPYPIESIQSLFQETSPNGKIWLATNTGVYGIDAQLKIEHFDTHSGLTDNDVSAVYVEADTLWAGTVKGLNKLLLHNDLTTFNFPSYFTGLHFLRNNKMVDTSFIGQLHATKKYTVPSDATLVELDLTALDFTSDQNLRYLCEKTEGLLPIFSWTPLNLLNCITSGFRPKIDSSWNLTGKLNFGVKLPAGAYQFRITALNGKNVFSNQSDHLQLIMLPRWYETFWFWLLCWGLFALGIWRINQTRVAFRELDAAASELQLQALRAQMNPHFVGNSINAIQQFFYPPDPVRASEYISLFTRLLRQTMHFSEQNFIAFKDEIAYDEDYLRMIQLRFSDRFSFEIVGGDRIPADMPFPAMLLQPILENATLHGLSPEGSSVLHLEFSRDEQFVLCTVVDNGVGYLEMQRRKKKQDSERKSKGLEMLHKKIQTMNRLYRIDLSLEMEDLYDVDPRQHGTKVILKFRSVALPTRSLLANMHQHVN